MDSNKPVAWAYETSDGTIIAASPTHKQIEWDVERWNGMVRDGRQTGMAKCVPLYRSPTLADDERSAIDRAIGWLGTIAETRGEQHSAGYLFDDAAAMRRLLDRTK